MPNLSLAVNISALQISEEFPNKLYNMMDSYAIQADSLELEITESLLMENISFVQPLLNDVREQNISFAIDDFGTGYSSINYLLKLPFDVLKIDRNFVSGIDLSNDLENLCRIIVEMGHSLNKAIVAEGVENQQELEKLASLNCEMIQGYFFSKPVSVDEMANLIKQGSF